MQHTRGGLRSTVQNVYLPYLGGEIAGHPGRALAAPHLFTGTSQAHKVRGIFRIFLKTEIFFSVFKKILINT